MTTPDQPYLIRIDGDVTGQFVVGNNNTTTSGPVAPRPAKPVPAATRKRIFVSYVREDIEPVDRLVGALTTAGHDVWLDRDDLLPGMHWTDEIRAAIRTSDHFLACFSPNYWKPRSYMNEELATAITLLRRMSRRRRWFIPAILAACELPDFQVGPGESIMDTIQVADFASDWDTALGRTLAAMTSDGGG